MTFGEVVAQSLAYVERDACGPIQYINKKMLSFQRWHSKQCVRAATVPVILACILSAATAKANTTSTPSYVPAQDIPCGYGLSVNDLQSLGPSVDRASRLDVAVRVSIDEHGQVSDAVVEKSSGNSTFDNAALQASRRAECRAFPDMDGKPVAVETNFVFSLPRQSADVTDVDPRVAATASNPLVASSAHPSSFPVSAANQPLLAAALPFEFGKSPDTAALARFGILPGSSKARLFEAWAKKIASDPEIKNYFSPDSNPAGRVSLALSRALSILDGMARISQADRERLMELSTRALDNAPPDCGGAKNMQVITSRYLSLATESDEALQAQLDAMFDLVKQSTQSTPPPQITAAQRLQGQLALSASIAEALKRDPTEAEDLGILMSGKQAELSSAAWCKAERFYRHALDGTAQPSRDWVLLAGLESQRRAATALTAALKNINAMAQATRQPAIEPKLFDYAEKVRRRVRPNISWGGKMDHQETLIEVHCAPSGNLESVKIVRSSGDPAWDQAALKAVTRSDPMPVDENGQAPRSFTITLRPSV